VWRNFYDANAFARFRSVSAKTALVVQASARRGTIQKKLDNRSLIRYL
jgi:hypothetical protein